MNLTQQLTQYCPWNEQEEADRRELLRRLESGEDLAGQVRQVRLVEVQGESVIAGPCSD